MKSILGIVVGLALVAGCHDAMHHDHDDSMSSSPKKMMAEGDVKAAVAVLHGTKGNEAVMGVVRFSEADGAVTVVAHVTGLAPSSVHGFHIHEFGDCTADNASSAGGHYDPEGTKHHDKPDTDPTKRHAGDMGNLTADANGVAHLEVKLAGVSISGKNAIIGRGVIVHEKTDDFGQPVGNAGARFACGVIGVANPGSAEKK